MDSMGFDVALSRWRTFVLLAVVLSVHVARAAVFVDLDDGWERTVGTETRSVDLPDDFRINLPWTADANGNRGFKPETSGVYRRTFVADERWQGRRVSVEIDGAQDRCEVYLNGRCVGGWDYGSLACEIDLTEGLAFGRENSLEVRCESGGRG